MGNLWSLNPKDWFTDEERGAGVKTVADPYGSLRQPLLDWLKPQVGQPGKQYAGEMVAPMSEQEKQSFDFLRKYGEGTLGPTFQQGKQEISKTLTDQYDPATSPYYQAVKASAKENLKERNRAIADEAAGGGRYFSGARVASQAKEAGNTERALNELLGGMSERERERKLQVLPQAMGYATTEQGLPLQQATAYQNLGALPRQIEQMLDTAKQGEWQRAEVDYPMQIGQMASGLPISPLYQQNTPDFLYEMLKSLLPAAGKAAGSMAGRA